MINRRITVVCGGISAERAPSLESGRSIYTALENYGFSNVTLFDYRGDNLAEMLQRRPDLAFLALHGQGGEDGTIQRHLEQNGIPYTGAGAASSAICMDKIAAKEYLQAHHIPTAAYVVLDRCACNDEKELAERLAEGPGYPLVLKPSRQGSGIGVVLVQKQEDLPDGLREAFDYGDTVLAEAYLSGIEITQSIIGDDVISLLPEVELVSAYPIRSYAVKYSPELSKHIIPARISDDTRIQVRRFGEEIYRGLRLRSCARIDYIIDNSRGPMVLEINTIPGMTETSALPAAAQAAGITMEKLVSEIAFQSMNRSWDKA